MQKSTKVLQKQINKAVDLYKSNKLFEAKLMALKLLEAEPKNTKILNLLAIVYEALDDQVTAEKYFLKILEIDENDFSAYNNLGLLYFKKYDFARAKVMHQKALEFNPSLSTLYTNLGNVYLEEQDYNNAEKIYLKAIQLNAKTHNVYFNLAKLYSLTNEYEKADEMYEKAVSISPNHVNLLYEYSLFCLSKKEYLKGFDLYRYRYHKDKLDRQTYLTSSEGLLTKTTDIRNKKILIKYEQGFGDVIQFIRFIPMFEERGAIVYVVVKDLLLLLFQKSYPDVNFIKKDEIVDFDYHMPLLDAAYFFAMEYEDIPFQNKYLRVDKDDSKIIYNKYFKNESKKKVGIVWRTNIVKGEIFGKQLERMRRNCTLDDFLAYFNIPEVQLYSLQVDVTDEERNLLNKNSIMSLGDSLVSFYDNALIIDNLDSLIAIDTVSSILAGALGKNVLLLLSNSADWRWTREDSTTNWFSSISIIRQESRGDWTGVFQRAIKTDLLSTEMNSTTRSLRLAIEYHQKGKLEEAEKIYREILLIEPKNFEVFHYLGLVAYQTGHSEQGIELIYQAITLNPLYTEAHKNFQNILLSSNEVFVQKYLNLQNKKFDIQNFSVQSMPHNLTINEKRLINSMKLTVDTIETDPLLNAVIALYIELLRDNLFEGLTVYFHGEPHEDMQLKKLKLLYKIVMVKGFEITSNDFSIVLKIFDIFKEKRFKVLSAYDKASWINVFIKFHTVYAKSLDNLLREVILPILKFYLKFNHNAKDIFCCNDNKSEFSNFIYTTSLYNPLFLNPICKSYFSVELQQLYQEALFIKKECYEQLDYFTKNLFMYWYTTIRDAVDDSFLNFEYALLINDTTDHYHPGCYMTSVGIKQMIMKRYDKVIDIPIHEIYTNGETFDVTEVDDFDDLDKYILFQKSLPIMEQKLANAQEVIINGEGTLHNKKSHVTFLLYLAYIAKTKYNKKVSIINHSPYPSYTRENRDSVADEIYKKVYDQLDFIGIREPIAKRLMDELKIESKLTFDCASIYLSKLDQELLVNVTPYQEYIVLSSSVIANQKTEVIFKDSIIELIRQNKNVVLLNGGPHEEKVFLENLYKHFKSEKQVSFLETKSVEHFLSIIKNATMLISGRFHYSIIAMFLQCPFVLLNSNTSKNFGLIEMTQLPNKILSFDLANLKDELLREVLKIEKEPKKYSLQESELKRLENLAKGNFIT